MIVKIFTLALIAAIPGRDAGAANVRWPSLAEQLAESRAEPASAFEALILANQDFSLLRPEEATDDLGVPLFLRVLWRRAHPELTYDAADPSGGYPLVLGELYEWMQTHQSLQRGPGERTTDDEAAEAAELTAAVGSNLRISGAQVTPRSESDIRVDYWDPQKIVAASNNITGGGSQSQFYSTDGGASWGQSVLPFFGADVVHSDPTVDWTSDGTAWSTTIGIQSAMLRMRAYKSVDSGAHWSFDATFSGTQTAADKQMMWTDHGNSSAFKDTVYACWHNGDPTYVNRRTGPAGAWQTPIQLSGAESTGSTIGCDVKTNGNGDVFVFWPTATNRQIFLVKSTNGGVSYGPPVQIGSTFDGYTIGVPSFSGRRALIYVSGGAYRTATKNLVYAAWMDLTGVVGCNAAANEPGTNVAASCKTRIWFARSTNGGASWSAPVMIDDRPELDDQFNQRLVVDETTGALSIVYYDTVADAGRKKAHVWYQSSFDDGASWFPAVQVTTAPTDETSDVAGANANQYGDYNGLSGNAGVLFPSWTDRRNAAKEEIWTAKITDPLCAPPGSPAIGTANPTAANQIRVTWGNGSPPSTTFDVYRAPGTCAAAGGFSLLAGAVSGSPFDDNTVSGGSTYAYQVTGLDAATCPQRSAPSGCVEATASGACTLAPSFAGIATAASQGSATCGVTMSWSPATPRCAGPVSYNVYRSTTSGFAPAPGNLVASGLRGAGFIDAASPLVSGTTYFYVARAVDGSNGVEEANAVRKGVTVLGPATTFVADTFEDGDGFDGNPFAHAALTGGADWVWSSALAQTPIHSWFAESQNFVSDRVLVTPPFVPDAVTTLSFWHTYAFDNLGTCFDGGTLEVSTNGGASWSVLPDAAFTAGGFNGTVSAAWSSPIAGLRAWCGGSIGALTEVRASLGAYAGQVTALRWHAGDDVSGAAVGWFVDSVRIADTSPCTPSEGLLKDGFESGNTFAWSGGSAP